MSDRDDFEDEQVFRDRDLGDEDEGAGPFPAEPAPGSPEAVEQAAETIRGLADEEDSEGSQARMDAALELLEGWGSNELSQPAGPGNCGASGATAGAPEGEQPAHRAPELLTENEALGAAVEAARRALGLSPHYGPGQVADAVRGLSVEVERLRREVASWHEGSAALQAELNRISEQNQNLRATIDHLHETLRGERSKLMAGGKGYL